MQTAAMDAQPLKPKQARGRMLHSDSLANEQFMYDVVFRDGVRRTLRFVTFVDMSRVCLHVYVLGSWLNINKFSHR
jgi:hypothetical protein